MRNTITLCRRELRAYFTSPMFYIVGLAYTLIVGIFAAQLIYGFSQDSLSYQQLRMRSPDAPGLNITSACLSPFFLISNFILLFFIPLLSMRLLAEEKRAGTFELVLSYPVRDGELVLAKFLSCLITAGVIIAATMVFPALLFYYGEPEPMVYCSGLLGLFLLLCAYVSMGLFWSSVTESQVVAGVLTFATLLGLWMLYGFEQSLSHVDPALGKIMGSLNSITHYIEFTQGVIDTSHIAYFILVTVFFLFSTLQVLQSKHWRG